MYGDSGWEQWTTLLLEVGNVLHLHATDPGLGEAGEWTIKVAEVRISPITPVRQGHRGVTWWRYRAAAGHGASNVVLLLSVVEMYNDKGM
ncbi:hypothetical protein [Mycobacterium uberis]|uniref:hypothetical protein n=1 Tax=Mycobacterium uberis TaxID=2162698 RepID=UPI00269FED32